MERVERERLERLYYRSDRYWRAAWSAVRECRGAANDFVVAVMEALGSEDAVFTPAPPRHYVSRVRIERPAGGRAVAYVTEDGRETWLLSPRTGYNVAALLAEAVAVAVGLHPEAIVEDGYEDGNYGSEERDGAGDGRA